jgi:hypothetical protein
VTPAIGSAEIEFHRRGLAALYGLFAILFAIIGILFVMVGWGTALDPGPWSGKWLPVTEWCVFGIGWACGAPQMWTMGRRYRHNFVRLGASDVTFHSVSEKEFQIPYAQIRSIDFDPAMRKRILTVTTAATTYTFDQRSCPRIGKVAELLKGRIGAAPPPIRST